MLPGVNCTASVPWAAAENPVAMKPSAPNHASPARQRGITLLGLMLALAVIGVLAAIAIPSYGNMTERMRVTTATRELVAISQAVERFRTINNFQYPASLADLPASAAVPAADPWGNPYQYLNFDIGPHNRIRKDQNLHPLNTEYDLYSMGPDGQSRAPLTAAHSRDDIVWGRDGSFVGKAVDF